MLKKFSCKVLSTFTAIITAFVSIFIIPTYHASAVGTNSGMVYIRHDYATNLNTTYTLPAVSSTQPSTRTTYPENRLPDGDQSVVYLKIGNNARGSGFIVDSHCIATAAHCLYGGSGFASSIQVIVCNSDFSNPILTCNAVSVHIPRYYVSTTANQSFKDAYDYGLIYVEEDLSEYGIFDLGIARDEFLASNTQVVASGFPGKRNETSTSTGILTTSRYYSLGNIETFNVTNDINNFSNSRALRFQATCVVSGGDSGGPVYAITYLNGKRYDTVIGIATGGGYNSDPENGDSPGYSGTFGVRITTNLLHFYLNNEYI